MPRASTNDLLRCSTSQTIHRKHVDDNTTPTKIKTMKVTILSVLALAAVAHAANPTFPTQWNSDYASKLILWQGGTYNSSDQTACCPKTSPQCKVQAQGQMGTQYVDGVNNKTALQVGSQAIINDYQTGKQMLVQPSKSGTGWTQLTSSILGKRLFQEFDCCMKHVKMLAYFMSICMSYLQNLKEGYLTMPPHS